MKAIIRERYGSPHVLELKEIETPTPKDDEALVRVHAASLNKADLVPLKPKNKIPGRDIAGRVEAVGSNVRQFQAGDEVFGSVMGAFAEYACAREDRLALKPTNTTFEEAAAVPVAAVTALQGLRDKGQIQP